MKFDMHKSTPFNYNLSRITNGPLEYLKALSIEPFLAKFHYKMLNILKNKISFAKRKEMNS